MYFEFFLDQEVNLLYRSVIAFITIIVAIAFFNLPPTLELNIIEGTQYTFKFHYQTNHKIHVYEIEKMYRELIERYNHDYK